MKYTTALIDLDDTLLDFQSAEREAFRIMCKKAGITYTNEKYTLFNTINAKWWGKFEQDECTKEKMLILRFSDYFSKLKISVSPHKANEFYRDALSQQSQEIDGATEIVKYLYEKGLDIYIVSNGNSVVQKSRLENKEFMKYISGLCVSESIGFSKPSPDFYSTCASMFNISLSDNTIIIGDGISSDVKGGNNIGIDVLWFNPSHKQLPIDYHVKYEVDSLEKIKDII